LPGGDFPFLAADFRQDFLRRAGIIPKIRRPGFFF